MNYNIQSTNPHFNGIKAFYAVERYLGSRGNPLDDKELARVKEVVAGAIDIAPDDIEIKFY